MCHDGIDGMHFGRDVARYSIHCLETYLYHHTHHIMFPLPIPNCRRVLLERNPWRCARILQAMCKVQTYQLGPAEVSCRASSDTRDQGLAQSWHRSCWSST